MKKSIIFIFAALLVVAFTLPAAAVEHEFGGYFRTRGFIQQNFTGEQGADSESLGIGTTVTTTVFDAPAGTVTQTTTAPIPTPVKNEIRQVDLRTRLYYTAVFSENFKFVNKFEIDITYGDGVAGDIGADGVILEVKNTYVDFNLGPTRWTVGTQGATIARGFLFSDDFTGVVARFQPGGSDELLVPFAWIARQDGGKVGTSVSDDIDIYALFPYIPIGIGTLNPYVVWHHPNIGEVNDLWWVGLDGDFNFDPFSVWFTGIYNFGKINEDQNRTGYLAAVGFKGNMDPVGFWVEGFYATGDDPDDVAAGDDLTGFFNPPGNSYYWAEIMGYGKFDAQVSVNAPDDTITNVMAVGGGVSFGAVENMKFGLDVWYAQLVEDAANGEKDLGIEIDAKITYALMENLNLDLVGAYLLAGDATSLDGEKDADPWEVGYQLSLSF